jgi:hypothetical protein
MNLSLAFAPLLPLPLIVAAAVLAALAVGLMLFRRRRGALLRGLVFLLLLAALLEPSVIAESRRPLDSVAALVVDRSASQDVGSRAADTDAAANAVEANMKRLAHLDVRRVEVETGASSGGTELFAALRRALSDVPPERVAGAVMITDGEVHDAPADAAALGFTAPLHALVTGDDAEFDRRVSVDSAPKFGLVRSRQTLRFRVVDDGRPPDGAPASVVIRRDGEEIGRLAVKPGEPVEFAADIAHAGENLIEIETPALPGELSPVNNVEVVTIQGIREALKVLLVSGEPHPGERAWRNLLKSDAAVDLIHFTILRPPEKQDTTPINELSLIAFPTRELFDEKIGEFDLIIFDRYQRRGVLPLLYFDNIARFVSGGGGLLIAAGPDPLNDDTVYDSPIASVLPLIPTGNSLEAPFRPELTDLGRRHPVTASLAGGGADPSWGRWFRLIEGRGNRGTTLMSGPDKAPLLTLSREGEGRVAMLMSDEVWLWARDFEGGGPYAELLRNVAHWLMKEPDLEEEALKLEPSEGRLGIVRRTLADTAPPVTVTLPGGGRAVVELAPAGPGRFRADIAAGEPGLYKATDGGHTAIAHVGPANPREFRRLVSTTDVLAPVAEGSGGSVRRLHERAGAPLAIPQVIVQGRAARHAGDGWIGLAATDDHEVTGVERVDLATGLLAMALMLAAVLGLWWREGR